MKKGQAEIQTIIGVIISLFILIVFIYAIIPLFQSITGAEQKQAEINKLANENNALRQALNNKDIEISRLNSLLTSLNTTISEKDNLISNLSGQITDKEKEIQDLKKELDEYKEKTYLPTINNNYYNILNYVERIENRFYTINLAISLMSIPLLGIVIKIFGLDVAIKSWWNKRKKKESEHETNQN